MIKAETGFNDSVDFWIEEMRRIGIELGPFGSIFEGMIPPDIALGYGMPSYQNIILNGKMTDVYILENENTAERKVYLHVKVR